MIEDTNHEDRGSNLPPERMVQLNNAWIESLLETLSESQTRADQARVTRAMRRIQNASEGQVSKRLAPDRWSSVAFSKISALAIAASLLVLAFFAGPTSGDKRAYAAVVRCEQSTLPLRQYRLRVINQREFLGRKPFEARLFLNDKNRFALEHPGWLGFGTTWIGGDDQQRWIVPPRGPIVLGGENLIGGWLARKSIASPYLHLNTLLNRMSRAYDLEMLPEETIESASVSAERFIPCVHVRGLIRQPRHNLPNTIDLWADSASGIAQRVVLQWPRNNSSVGPLRWTLDLVEPPNVPDNWFDYSGHAPPDRPVIRVRSPADLEAL